MSRKWLAMISLFGIALLTILLPSCGSNQRLVSISVTPANVVFGGVDPALFAQLSATGIYEHPPATKDITNQVTWTSDITQVAVVTSAGKITPNTNCGVANITASFKTDSPTGNIISGTMNVTVDGPTPCPNSTPTP